MDLKLDHVYLAVIAGGKGTRLFPISNHFREKQFCPTKGGHSFLQRTIINYLSIGVSEEHVVVLVSNERQARLATAQATAIGVPAGNIWNLGQSQGFYSAMVEAALRIADKQAIIINTPADHYIDAGQEFRSVIMDAVDEALRGNAVLVGVETDDMAVVTSCGNIVYRPEGGTCFPVERFVEKPCKKAAAKLIQDGCAVNTGIGVWQAGTLKSHAPKRTIDLGAEKLMASFKNKLKLAIGGFSWQDCGTFKGLYAALEKSGANVTIGEVSVGRHTRHSLLFADDGLALSVSDDVVLEDVAIVFAKVGRQPVLVVLKLEETQAVSQLAKQYHDGTTIHSIFSDDPEPAVDIVGLDGLNVKFSREKNRLLATVSTQP